MNEEEKNSQELDDLRKLIDEIDDGIVDLLNKRANTVIKIGNLKKSLNLETFQPKREEEVKERIRSKSTIFKKRSLDAIWKEIMSASKVIQGTITKVGYQTYSTNFDLLICI